jgi:hypothetical protein
MVILLFYAKNFDVFVHNFYLLPFKELFENGELSKSTNFWDQVANFTPDSSSVVITSPRRIESLADLSENLPAGTFERFKTLVIDKGLITLNNAYCV